MYFDLHEIYNDTTWPGRSDETTAFPIAISKALFFEFFSSISKQWIYFKGLCLFVSQICGSLLFWHHRVCVPVELFHAHLDELSEPEDVQDWEGGKQCCTSISPSLHQRFTLGYKEDKLWAQYVMTWWTDTGHTKLPLQGGIAMSAIPIFTWQGCEL